MLLLFTPAAYSALADATTLLTGRGLTSREAACALARHRRHFGADLAADELHTILDSLDRHGLHPERAAHALRVTQLRSLGETCAAGAPAAHVSPSERSCVTRRACAARSGWRPWRSSESRMVCSSSAAKSAPKCRRWRASAHAASREVRPRPVKRVVASASALYAAGVKSKSIFEAGCGPPVTSGSAAQGIAQGVKRSEVQV